MDSSHSESLRTHQSGIKVLIFVLGVLVGAGGLFTVLRPGKNSLPAVLTNETELTPPVSTPVPTRVPYLNQLNQTVKTSYTTYTLVSPIYLTFDLNNDYFVSQASNSAVYENNLRIVKKNCEPLYKCTLATIEWDKYSPAEVDLRWDGAFGQVELTNEFLATNILSMMSTSQCSRIFPEEFELTTWYGQKVWTGTAKKEACPNVDTNMTAMFDTMSNKNDHYFVMVWLWDKSAEAGRLLNSIKYGFSPETLIKK